MNFMELFSCFNLIVASLNLLGNIFRHNTKIICTLYNFQLVSNSICVSKYAPTAVTSEMGCKRK
jgi:hypothetical protein